MPEKERKGFTLIEILLASTIFVSVLLVAMAGFAQVLKIQRKTAGSSTYIQRFPLEEMSREIRMAKSVDIGANGFTGDGYVGTDNPSLRITTQSSQVKDYKLANERVAVFFDNQLHFLSPADVKVVSFNFRGYESISNATEQPFIMIRLQIEGMPLMQTSVVLRNYQKYTYQ